MRLVIGVYGLMGSGKSTVSQLIESDFGFDRIDADQIGHECLDLPFCKEKVIQKFSASILQKNGLISHERLSSIIFNNPGLKKQLECILWPIMTERMIKFIHQKRKVVLDAALLFTAKWNVLCDYTIYVETDENSRIRFLESKPYDPEQIQKILASQKGIADQKSKADFIIQNIGAREDLSNKVFHIMTEIENREKINSLETDNKKETRKEKEKRLTQLKEEK